MADQSTHGTHIIKADSGHRAKLVFESLCISPEYTVIYLVYIVLQCWVLVLHHTILVHFFAITQTFSHSGLL